MIDISGKENRETFENDFEGVEKEKLLQDKEPSKEMKAKKKSGDRWDVKYFYKDNYVYSIYEDYLLREDDVLHRKNKDKNEDLLEGYLLDIYCKLWIFYHSENHLKNTGSKKDRLDQKTPNGLKEMGLITTDTYSDWKKYIDYSIVDEAFEVKKKKYIVHGINNLLENPTMCILLLWDCVELKRISKKDVLWETVKKVIDAYNNDEECTGLKDAEKERIVNKLTMESDTDEINTLWDQLQKRNENKNIEEKKQKEQMKMIAQEYGPQLKEIQKKIKESGVLKKVEIKENVNNCRFYFSTYLAPIIAAICCTYEIAQNLLLVDKPIYTSTISYLEVRGKNVDVDMMKNYGMLKRYSEFIDQIGHVQENMQDENILIKYDTICNYMIYKIMSDKNPLKKDEWFVQFYVMEQLMNLQMISQIVDELCKNSKISEILCKNKKEFKKEPYEIKMKKYVLERTIENSNFYYSVFTKDKSVSIALKWLLDKFDNEQSGKDYNYYRYITKASRKLKRLDNTLYDKEVSMLKTYREQDIQLLKNSEELRKRVSERLNEYSKRMELLKEEEKKPENYPRGGKRKYTGLSLDKIKRITTREIQSESEQRRKIKAWVIKIILMRELYPEIKLEWQENTDK